jgi:hypothetical protein
MRLGECGFPRVLLLGTSVNKPALEMRQAASCGMLQGVSKGRYMQEQAGEP